MFNKKHINATPATLAVGFMCFVILLTLLTSFSFLRPAQAVVNPQNGGVGVEGKISAPAPTVAPTISSPRSGQSFTNLPITVTGICQSNLLIKLFKNNVFAGSALCQNNNYSIVTDLFSGANDLVVRAYDDLDQASPDSNVVSLVYDDNSKANFISKITLTTNYARRGANPNQLLTWPVTISGGVGPYAVSVDWGDGSQSDIYSVATPGDFTIKHKFEQSGVYRALIKATDKNGAITYLQLTAISNGEVKDAKVAGAESATTNKTIVLWQPVAISVPLIISTFWLGKRYASQSIKKKFMKGENPF